MQKILKISILLLNYLRKYDKLKLQQIAIRKQAPYGYYYYNSSTEVKYFTYVQGDDGAFPSIAED